MGYIRGRVKFDVPVNLFDIGDDLATGFLEVGLGLEVGCSPFPRIKTQRRETGRHNELNGSWQRQNESWLKNQEMVWWSRIFGVNNDQVKCNIRRLHVIVNSLAAQGLPLPIRTYLLARDNLFLLYSQV